MSSTLTWGTTPATPPVAALDPVNGLQPMVDAIAAAGSGGVIELPNGTFYANPASPSTPLTIPTTAYDIAIVGIGAYGTIIRSPILCNAGRVRLAEFHCDPGTAAYGIRIYNGGAFVARCKLDRLIVGNRDPQDYLLGPTNGLELDGAGVLQAVGCTFAFCSGSGAKIDSTGTVPPNDQPNTTLQFDMCSFVGNGLHGAHILGSCSICEFRGGNAEQNGRGGSAAASEIRAESMNNLVIKEFDFETNNVIDNQLFITNCSPVHISGCNFTTGAGKATRTVVAFSSSGVTMGKSRISGFGAVGVVRADENCQKVNIQPDVIIDTTVGNGWIEDYSR